jgi:hypothetical protein
MPWGLINRHIKELVSIVNALGSSPRQKGQATHPPTLDEDGFELGIIKSRA